MANCKHKLLIVYTEISDWVKNYKKFDDLTQEDVLHNLSKDLEYTGISEKDQNAIIQTMLNLHNIIKR